MPTFQGLLSSWSTLRFCLWSIWLVFYSVYSWLIWSHQRQLIFGFWEFRIWLAIGVFHRDIHIVLRILCCRTLCYTKSAKQYWLVILILMYSERSCFCFTWRSNRCGKCMEMPQQNFTELASWFAGHPPNHQTFAKEVHVFMTACLFKINIYRSWCLSYSYSLQKALIYPTKGQRSENLRLFTGWQLLAFIIHEMFRPFLFPRSAANDRIIGKLTLAGLFNQLENLVGGTVLGHIQAPKLPPQKKTRAVSRKLRNGF